MKSFLASVLSLFGGNQHWLKPFFQEMSRPKIIHSKFSGVRKQQRLSKKLRNVKSRSAH